MDFASSKGFHVRGDLDINATPRIIKQYSLALRDQTPGLSRNIRDSDQITKSHARPKPSKDLFFNPTALAAGQGTKSLKATTSRARRGAFSRLEKLSNNEKTFMSQNHVSGSAPRSTTTIFDQFGPPGEPTFLLREPTRGVGVRQPAQGGRRRRGLECRTV